MPGSTAETHRHCLVPGCKRVRTDEDCCPWHARKKVTSPNTLQNDGVIDWLAIDLMVEGARDVKLTWLERDIVAARLLAGGVRRKTLAQNYGIYIETESRAEELARMVAAILEGDYAGD